MGAILTSARVLEIETSMARLGQTIVGAAQALGNVLAPYQGLLSGLARDATLAQRMADAGWLPHYTTPFDRLGGEEVGSDAVAESLTAYYRDHWPDVRAAFVEHLERYDLDAETKASFMEALGTHEHGFYRATGRLLFPEIERVARIEFHDGSASARITSIEELRKQADNMSPHDTDVPGFFGLQLYDRLIDHLYSYASDPEKVAILAKDPVPNRHATLHGLVPYSSMQNSINALIITDFIFQVVCALKESAKDPAP